MKEQLKQFYKQNSTSEMMSDEAAKRVKDNIFARLGDAVENTEPTPISYWTSVRTVILKSYVAAPLALVLLIGGTAYASADSLPGDALYGVKRTMEEAQIVITPRAEDKLELQLRFAQKRVEELEALRASHIPEQAMENNQSDKKDETETVVTDEQLEQNPERSNNSAARRQFKAREEASKAIEHLNQTQQKWQERGDQEKTERIQKKVEEFRQKLEDRTNPRLNRHNDDSDNSPMPHLEFRSTLDGLHN